MAHLGIALDGISQSLLDSELQGVEKGGKLRRINERSKIKPKAHQPKTIQRVAEKHILHVDGGSLFLRFGEQINDNLGLLIKDGHVILERLGRKVRPCSRSLLPPRMPGRRKDSLAKKSKKPPRATHGALFSNALKMFKPRV